MAGPTTVAIASQDLGRVVFKLGQWRQGLPAEEQAALAVIVARAMHALGVEDETSLHVAPPHERS